ncbi:MAG TPA: NUDIX hydrolase [Mycobacteriales bacterium]|nr:NUDIX hydrolase [Mycobacteriales bacterium]
MRDAATVILVRDGAEGLEVYLLRRIRQLPFAGGMCVFPGGTVDPGDTATSVPRLGTWPAKLRADPAPAAALISAAIRETFEETGVLVATTATADLSWEPDRQALIRHDRVLAEVLVHHDAAVRPDALQLWSHWVTPEGEPRRYDTRFFLAALPAGQNPRYVGGEAQEAMWMRPDRTAPLPMLPPTRATLGELAAYGSVSEVVAAAAGRAPERILPVRRGDVVELPDGTVM